LNKKKIVFLTGTRADFGKLKPLIDVVENSDLFECYIFVTGLHTLDKYGSTFLEIKKQNYQNIFVFMNQTRTIDTDTILANTITGFGNFVKEIRPEMIIIHGDRVEALSGALVGSLNHILVSHIEGGELSGNIDEIIRHTITKLSNCHFVANEEAKKRLLQMGESEESIFPIGSPDIDIMMSDKLPTIKQVKERYEIPFDNYAILIFHPETTKLSTTNEQIKIISSSLIKSQLNYVVIMPNNDYGSNVIIDEYDVTFKNNNSFKVFPSLRFEYFLTLLKNAKFIIGNSSVGIREAEIYGIPVINLGSRQKNRTKNNDILQINFIQNEIIDGIKSINGFKSNIKFNFGDGKSSEKFFALIKDHSIWNLTKLKQFVDLS